MITKENRNELFLKIDSCEHISDITKMRAKNLIDFVRFDYPLASTPTFVGDDEVDSIVIEWFSMGARKVTFYISHDQVTFLKINGESIEEEKVFSPNICCDLFRWLYS